MKHISRKEVLKDADKVIRLKAGQLSSLLSGATPSAFNRGVKGRNWDAYLFNHEGKRVWVVRGVRNLIGNPPRVDTYRYEANAKHILEDWVSGVINSEELHGRLWELLDDFLTNA